MIEQKLENPISIHFQGDTGGLGHTFLQ